MGQTLTPELLAHLIEDAPVRALARLALPDPSVRHDACLEVATHLLMRLDGPRQADHDQLTLPLT